MSNRALRIALIVSIVLNLFVIGGLVGAALVWSHRADHPLSGLTRSQRLREAARALPLEERRALLQALRDTVLGLKPQADAGRAARREMARLMAQPTLDAAALKAAMARSRESDTLIRAAVDDRLADFLAKLPQADRVTLTEALRHSVPRAAPRISDPPGNSD